MPGNVTQPISCSWCGNNFAGPIEWCSHACAPIQAIVGFTGGDLPGTVDDAPWPRLVKIFGLTNGIITQLHQDMVTLNALVASYINTYVVPHIFSITPATGAHNTAVNVTIVGANLGTLLPDGSAIQVPAGSGITVSAVTVNPNPNNATPNITATFTIANSAPHQVNAITITTAGGVSNAVNFTVT